jgi:ABC-type lipoprotein export system ATPase subunit
MNELRTRYGAAFFFASHDARLLARMDRIVALHDGELTDAGGDHARAASTADTHSIISPSTRSTPIPALAR